MKYSLSLDGLRGIAITMVLLEHFSGFGPRLNFGYFGVDLFFVISGFLITSILIAEPPASFGSIYRRFLGRRALRIFPPYYLLLGILFLTDFFPAREHALSLIAYIYNYIVVDSPELHFAGGGRLSYLWSLSVEEQFYLFWPVAAIALRRKPAMLLSLTLGLIVVSYGQLLWNIFPSLSRFNYVGLINRMGSLGMGAAAAIVMQAPWGEGLRRCLTNKWTAYAGVAGLALFVPGHGAWRLPLVGLASAIVVIQVAVPGRVGPFAILRWFPLCYLGRISYGVYLYHAPLSHAMTTYMFDPVWLSLNFSGLGPFAKLRWHSWIFKLPLYSAASIAVAAVSFRWFERPILKLKDRWFA